VTNAPDFIARYWQSGAAGELLIGGKEISSIAEAYGTPLFVYDSSVLDRKYAALRRTLPSRFAISYSVKANPNPAVLKFFLAKGCGLEVASAGEIYQACSAGCPPRDILFAGPGKTGAELEFALRERVGEIHSESHVEIARISRICRRIGVRARIAIRVNPNEQGQGGAMQMGGKSAPFGVDEEQLEPLLRCIMDDCALDFSGIHLFVGTQILDHRILLAQYRRGVEIARRTAAFMGTPLYTLDFGGGLGVPYFPGDSELDLEGLRKGLQSLLAEIEGEECFSQTKFMIEPGRFLAGEAGIYVARVNDIKVSRGKKYLILDGGMHHHLAASGNLGQVIKRNFPILLLNKMDSPSIETVDVVGPLCTPLDTLGRSVQFPTARIGDLVGVFQSGAYARAASPLGFLSHLTPPEVWVEGGSTSLIRYRGKYQDYTQDIPDFAADSVNNSPETSRGD
jgi:diaminopimelate decarboxylase